MICWLFCPMVYKNNIGYIAEIKHSKKSTVSMSVVNNCASTSGNYITIQYNTILAVITHAQSTIRAESYNATYHRGKSEPKWQYVRSRGCNAIGNGTVSCPFCGMSLDLLIWLSTLMLVTSPLLGNWNVSRMKNTDRVVAVTEWVEIAALSCWQPTTTNIPLSAHTAHATNTREAITYYNTRMWANAQPDGRPAEHRWRPLFNAAKFGWRPLLDAVQ